MGAGGSRFKSGCPDKVFMSSKLLPTVFNVRHASSDWTETTAASGKCLLSRPCQTPFLFSSLVLSARLRLPPESAALLEVQFQTSHGWSDFYKLGLFLPDSLHSFPDCQDAQGRVEIDEVCPAEASSAYRFRLTLSGLAQADFVAAALVSADFHYTPEQAACLPHGSYAHPAEPISQMEQKTEDRRRICSPTSLCMALRALGKDVSLDEVLTAVYDKTAGIYGNWMANTAAANRLGALSYFRRFESLAELADFLSPDSLVVASVGYGPGELTNAPLERTAGHLVLVRGWGNGQVLAADPAAETRAAVLRAYHAQEFAKVWLHNKKGAAYVVRRK